MQLSEIRINLTGPSAGRLKAFCSLTFDHTLVIHDVKLIQGTDGLFLAMPSRKLCDHCPRCREKNHLRARFCNGCGMKLDENRHSHTQNGNGSARIKLHADIAHPINTDARLQIERRVLAAFQEEVEKSRLPGYVPPKLDSDLGDGFEFDASPDAHARLRPAGTGSSGGRGNQAW